MGFFQNIGNLFYRFGSRLGGDASETGFYHDMVRQVNRIYSMHYDAASTTRTRNDWPHTTDSPYNNIKDDLKRMIGRSRESSDNNAISENVDKTILGNVVGDVGIRPEAVVKNDNGDLIEPVNKALMDAWKRYNDMWDRSGKCTYYESQKLGLKTIINSGSVLQNTVKAPKGSFLPISNQLIEPDRLNWAKDAFQQTHESAKPKKQTQFGMEIDKYGVPQYFHVKGISRPIKAANMSIRFFRRRPEQYIGVPWKAPVLKSLWDLTHLIEDKAVASRIQAMISLWIHKEDANSFLKNADSSYRLQWEPGRNIYTKHKPEVIQSKDDLNETFEPMIRLLLSMVAIGLGISYQILTRDLKGMNFASSRANILEDRRTFKVYQTWFIKDFCQKDWERFVFWTIATGKVPGVSLFNYSAEPWRFNDCFWTPPRWDWVDPLKDAQAAQLLVENNMMSLKDYYGSQGKNYIEEIRQIAEEKKMLLKYGIKEEAPEPDKDPNKNKDMQDVLDRLDELEAQS